MTQSKKQSKVWIISSGKHPDDVIDFISQGGKNLPNIKDLSVIYYDVKELDDCFHYHLLFDNHGKKQKISTFYMQEGQIKKFADALAEHFKCPFEVEKSTRHALNRIREKMQISKITKAYKENDIESMVGDDDDESTNINSPEFNSLSDPLVVQSNSNNVNREDFSSPASKPPTILSGLEKHQFKKIICKGRIPFYALFKYAERHNDWSAKKKLMAHSLDLLEFEALVMVCIDNTYFHVDPKDELIGKFIDMAAATKEQVFNKVDAKSDFDILGATKDFMLISNLISNFYLSYASLLKFFILEGQTDAKEFLERHKENFLKAETGLKSGGNAKLFAKLWNREYIMDAFKELKYEFEWGEALWKAEENLKRASDHDVSGFEPDKMQMNLGAGA